MGVWRARREENCQEGLAGLGWRGERVPSSAVANQRTERILLDQSLPSDSTWQQAKREPLQMPEGILSTINPLGISGPATCRITSGQSPASMAIIMGFPSPESDSAFTIRLLFPDGPAGEGLVPRVIPEKCQSSRLARLGSGT